MLRRIAAPLMVISGAVLLLSGFPWPCPIRLAIGVPCPSCGMTRAARAAIQLQFDEATHQHPLWFVVLPALGVFLAVELVTYVRTGHAANLDKRRGVRVFFGALMVALVGVWLARFFGAFGGPASV